MLGGLLRYMQGSTLQPGCKLPVATRAEYISLILLRKQIGLYYNHRECLRVSHDILIWHSQVYTVDDSVKYFL